MYGVFARFALIIGSILIFIRRQSGEADSQAFGDKPRIPKGKPQAIPTLKMPAARGWDKGQLPEVAPGLVVNAYASGLLHPRWIDVLPNGDVLVAEACNPGGKPQGIFDFAMKSILRRARALGVSAKKWFDEFEQRDKWKLW